MLHEINFLDWRKANSRAVYRLWSGISMVCLLILGFVEWSQYHDHQAELIKVQQQHQQIKSAHEMVSNRYQQWLLRESQHQITQQANVLFHRWITMSKKPSQVMNLVQATLPNDVYLDRLMLNELDLTIQGIVAQERSATLLAKAMDARSETSRVYRLNLDDVLLRWQRDFYPFEMVIGLSEQADE